MTSLRLWSGGVPLDDLGVVGDDLQISTVFGDGGCGVDQITWSMGLPRGFAHPALQKGAVVELRRGPLVLATVINDEPDVDAWKFTAKGLIKRPADFIAVNSAGTPTNNLKDALLAAVANGLEIKIPSDVPNVLVSIDSADQVLTVADLLNRYCAQNNKRWGITGSGWLRFYTDPTTTRWVLTPDAPSLASASGQVSRLRVRYATSVDESGSPATLGMVVVGATGKNVVESFQDITNEGALTAPQATTIAAGLLAQQAPQDRFTSGVAPGPGQIMNIGDVPMDGGLWLIALDVAEGAKVRSTGWRNPDVGVNGMGYDWIAGAATWSKPSGLTISPMSMAASTFGDTMAQLRAGVQAAQGQADKALAVGTPDWLQSLINPSSATTLGALPASAAIGDLCVIDGKPYVCTLAYTSGGTLTANWVQATDPRTVALISATATAVFKADNANTAAQTAQASADGKNSVTYAASAPSSSSPGRVGDTWFVFSGAQITAQYKLASVSGSTYSWSSVQLNSAVIANIDAGKITTGVLSAIDISGVNITGSTITGTTIAGGTVTGATVKTSNTSNYWALGNDYVGGNTLRGVLSNGGIAAIDYSIVGTGGQLSITNQASSVYSGITLTSASGTQSVSIDTGTIALNGSVSAGALTASGAVSLSGANLSTPSMPVGTVGSTAGFSGSSSAQMIRSSSGRKYKVDVHNLTDAPQAIGSSILEIEPVRYRDRYAVEQYIDTDTGETGEPRWWVGWTAEQFIDAGWGDLAIRDPESGDPEGLMYERVLPALVPELRARFEAIEAENASLRSKVGQLESTLVVMASRLTALENK